MHDEVIIRQQLMSSNNYSDVPETQWLLNTKSIIESGDRSGGSFLLLRSKGSGRTGEES
jgi:hypothetical protein